MKKERLLIIVLFIFFFAVIIDRSSLLIPSVSSIYKCEEKEVFNSGERQVNLIELYTSEGCSSCPPAEKWLNSLYQNDELYNTFIPLAFHVPYWDYIGHKDPFAKEEFTQRQRNYAKEWNSKNIYTPEFVLNGQEWRPFLRKSPSQKEGDVGKLIVSRLDTNLFEASFSKKGEYTLNAALLVHGIENKIRSGENHGKTLRHYFVVNSHQKFLLKDKVKITFNTKSKKYKNRSLAFWLTPITSQIPIQATGGCIQ